MNNENWQEDNGNGYYNDDGTRAVVRCPACGLENYAMAVSSGVCYSCGFDANEQEPLPSYEDETDDGLL